MYREATRPTPGRVARASDCGAGFLQRERDQIDRRKTGRRRCTGCTVFPGEMRGLARRFRVICALAMAGCANRSSVAIPARAAGHSLGTFPVALRRISEQQHVPCTRLRMGRGQRYQGRGCRAGRWARPGASGSSQPACMQHATVAPGGRHGRRERRVGDVSRFE